MNDTSKFLIEQEVYGIKEESTGVLIDGNKYITESIMDYLDTENPTYTLMDTLFESIEYSNDFSFYTPLLEAADESKDLESLADELKRTRDPKKIEDIEKRSIKTVSRLGKWFMSLDPNKKGKTWCTVIKVLMNIIGAALIVIPYIVIMTTESVPVALTFAVIEMAALLVGSIGSTVNGDKRIEYNMAGYEENMRKWDDALDKLEEIIKDLEDKKNETTDPLELKEINKRLADAEKSKRAFEKSIKQLIKVKKQDTYNKTERAADMRAAVVASAIYSR